MTPKPGKLLFLKRDTMFCIDSFPWVKRVDAKNPLMFIKSKKIMWERSTWGASNTFQYSFLDSDGVLIYMDSTSYPDEFMRRTFKIEEILVEEYED